MGLVSLILPLSISVLGSINFLLPFHPVDFFLGPYTLPLYCRGLVVGYIINVGVFWAWEFPYLMVHIVTAVVTVEQVDVLFTLVG